MIVAILAIFMLALLAPLLYRVAHAATGWLLAIVPVAIALYFYNVPSTEQGERLTNVWQWSPELGISFSFALDGLSLLFVMLICGIGALVLIYAGGYLSHDTYLDRFYSFLLLFMAAMLGVVLADNLLTLFIFWELTSISSFLLIGFTHERPESRAAARQALMITGSGGLVLFIGLLMLGSVGGSYELSYLLNQGAVVQAHPLYGWILALILVGAFTKSAQFPFHFWLPGAMEAPTPVSAYLHSATMVKAGVYLLARLSPVLGGTDAWTITVSAFGATTMLVGGILSFYQTDLKRILAYTTVSALGTLMLLLGLGSEHAVSAAMVFLLAHALYKGALFMLAGIIDHETGTRNVEKLGGLLKSMPITAWITFAAAISLASFGPLISFIAKELLFEAVLESEIWIYAIMAVLASALFVTEALILSIKPFFGEAKETPKHPHDPPFSMWLGPIVLVIVGVVAGLVPTLGFEQLTASASSAVLNEHVEFHLGLWHGVTPALGMTLLAVVVGIVGFRIWVELRKRSALVERLLGFWPAEIYRLSLDGINRVARKVTSTTQDGLLRHYLIIIFSVTVAFVGLTLVLKDGFPPHLTWTEVRFYEIALAVLMLLSAILSLRSSGRLSTIATLGIVGYGVALIYILYGAPDLAMTQILVETLTLLLFVLAFHHLPRFKRYSTTPKRLRDFLIAISVGSLMTILVLTSTATPPNSRISDFFIENSKTIAHGSNIVNVILVDFRGIDTFGEITVLSMAAFGVYALLKLGRPKQQGVFEEGRPMPRGRRFVLRRAKNAEGDKA
jgi:multicomponent Na+:H+ antiporter subunit A